MKGIISVNVRLEGTKIRHGGKDAHRWVVPKPGNTVKEQRVVCRKRMHVTPGWVGRTGTAEKATFLLNNLT